MKSATLPARMLGATLERLREQAGFSREGAARELDMGQATLWRIERAQWERPPKKTTVTALCHLYGVDQATVTSVMELLDQAKADGWWKRLSDEMNPNFSTYVALEDSARRMISYQDRLLPGLLQTPSYRRAMATMNDPTASDDLVVRGIELATRRQERLRAQGDARIEADVILAAEVLPRRIGGAAVMFEQLMHLAELMFLETVNIQVIPAGECHAGLSAGGFVLLEFPPSRLEWMPVEPPMVYIEHFTGSLSLGEDKEVQRYRTAFDVIRKAALGPEESRELIVRTAEGMKQ